MFSYRVKTFQEFRYARRMPGAAPDQWTWLGVNDPLVSKMITPPLDTQINEWMQSTGAQIVPPVASPSIYTCWVDAAMTLRCIQTALTVLYRPGPEDDRPSTIPIAAPSADGRSAA
jgi:hypothetical protein